MKASRDLLGVFIISVYKNPGFCPIYPIIYRK